VENPPAAAVSPPQKDAGLEASQQPACSPPPPPPVFSPSEAAPQQPVSSPQPPSPPPPPPPAFSPSPEQQKVVDIVKRGQSVFFTGASLLPRRSSASDSWLAQGSAGVGKSALLSHIVDVLKVKHGEWFGKKVAITAATGIAATHINGTTLHSLFGACSRRRRELCVVSSCCRHRQG